MVRNSILVVLAYAMVASSTISLYADEKADKEAIVARLESLQHLEVRFTSDWDYTPPNVSQALSNVRPSPLVHLSPPRTGHYLYQELFRFNSGKVILERHVEDQTIHRIADTGWPIDKLVTMSLSGGRTEILTWGNQLKYANGLISSDTHIPDEWTLDIGLGLRLYRTSSFFVANDLSGAALSYPSGDIIELKLEDGASQRHLLDFDRKNGYALCSYSLCGPNGDLYERWDCSGFAIFDNLVLPQKIVRKGMYKDAAGKEQCAKTVVIKVSEYRFPSQVDEGAFLVRWPKGTHLFEARSNLELYPKEERVYTDEDIAKAISDKQAANDLTRKTAEDEMKKALAVPDTNP